MYWLRITSDVGVDVQVTFVVGCKVDLPRMVETRTGESWAAEMGFRFCEASAKSGEGVQALFDEIVLCGLLSWRGVPEELLEAYQQHRDQ